MANTTDAARPTSKRVSVGGVSLHYLRAGSGENGGNPPVVLLHGGIIDSATISWSEVVPALAEEFPVYALDLPGYGESDRPEDAPYTTAYHVGMVRDFMAELDLTGASLVGSSLGGGIALGLVLSTTLADRLVLVDSFGLGRELPNGRLTWLLARVGVLNELSLALLARSKRLTRASLGNVVADPGALDDEVVDRIYRALQRPDPGMAFRRWRADEVTWNGYRTCHVDQFDQVPVPTLVIHGREDEVFPVEWAERAADRIQEARLEVFEDCAHWPPRENHDRFVETVRGFLRDEPGGSD